MQHSCPSCQELHLTLCKQKGLSLATKTCKMAQYGSSSKHLNILLDAYHL